MRTTQTDNEILTQAPHTGVWSILRATVASFVVLTAVTGVIYPLVITGIAKTAFPNQAGGSLIDKDGKPTDDESKAVGSSLIGQTFDQPGYFWSRPSATVITGGTVSLGYNAAQSTGSNTGPLGMTDTVKGRVDALKAADPANVARVPIDLVTASASGLDPHESVAAAMYQAPRIARLRHMQPDVLEKLIRDHTQAPALGALGEQTVNVLELNLALDALAPMPATTPAATAATTTQATTAH